MVWYGWVIIGSVAFGAIAAVIAALRRGRQPQVDREKLTRIAAQQAQGELDADKKAEQQIREARDTLKARLGENQTWYGDETQKIDNEVKDEKDRLVSDPDALDARIDELLKEYKEPG